ncbi:hypothetical protein L2Y96_22635 [Luteibacter aegosomaticola]|uniref:hypothetical protein n=1 Tax=Luteibacter aegosomaticola TaxID=2911538 RepID=UPI001FFB305E|nr:hypothetical protein [Luteibacter aegosomaticola]UPG90142.1 hypothetical protein L2Y96_22635 [Luteibacter aegosomaticola]
MRFLLTVVPLTAALIIAACSPAAPPAPQSTAAPSSAPAGSAEAAATSAEPGKTSPATAALGTADWFAWVDKTLNVSDDGHGPQPNTPAWEAAVNAKLGQEAPQASPGSTEWQQAVDALLRTRVVTH